MRSKWGIAGRWTRSDRWRQACCAFEFDGDPSGLGRHVWLWRVALACLLPVVPACQPSDLAVRTSAAANVAANSRAAPPAKLAESTLPPIAKPVLHSTNRFPVDFGGNSPAVRVDGRLVRMLPTLPGTDRRPPERLWMPPAFGKAPSGALILYDTTSTYGWLGELYAMAAQALVSHFGQVTCAPVSKYKASELLNYQAAVCLGSTYDELLPLAFLDDVFLDQTPVIWIYDNIWQLVNRVKDFSGSYGYKLTWLDLSAIDAVLYREAGLTRDPSHASGLGEVSVTNPQLVSTLATAVRVDGSTLEMPTRRRTLRAPAKSGRFCRWPICWLSGSQACDPPSKHELSKLYLDSSEAVAGDCRLPGQRARAVQHRADSAVRRFVGGI